MQALTIVFKMKKNAINDKYNNKIKNTSFRGEIAKLDEQRCDELSKLYASHGKKYQGGGLIE
jgi:hypothetical protein